MSPLAERERVSVREVRETARRQGARLSGLSVAIVASVLGVLLVGLFVVLDYKFNQDPHRIVKVLLGVGGLCTVLALPRFGILLVPLVTPFLLWIPPTPIPGVNALNVLVFGVLGMYALPRILQRQPVMRKGRMTPIFIAFIALAALTTGRAAAFPTGFYYDAGAAGWELFRTSLTLCFYFQALAMIRGAEDRRRLGWALVIGLAIETIVTIAFGRNGRGGRAIGSLGHSNELGAFLAIYSTIALAMVSGVRNAFAKLFLLVVAGGGVFAAFLSLSRGAIIALVAGVLYVGFRTSKVLAIVLVLLVVSSPAWIPDYVVARFNETAIESEDGSEGLDNSSQLRLDTWTAIIDLVQDNAIFGVGFCGLGYVLPQAGEALGLEVKDSAHNTYMRFLGEMGIFGLLLLVVWIATAWKLGWDTSRHARRPFDRALGDGLSGAMVAMALLCWFGDRFLPVTISGGLWMLCAICDDVFLTPTEARA